MGAVGDDVMRALGIMYKDAKVPDYNKKAHRRRIFGRDTNDLGGVNGRRLGDAFELFLIGALVRTAAWQRA